MAVRECTRTLICGIFDSTYAYIYIWISKKWRIAYVGQTAGGCGTLGRAAQHVSGRGTLRVRFEEETGVQLERAQDLELYSFRLPKNREFCSIESSFREAVEYRVQLHLHELKAIVSPTFTLVSNVRYTERARLSSLKLIASEISERFKEFYEERS